MDHAITIGMVVEFILIAGGIGLFLALVVFVLSVYAKGFTR